MGLNYYSTFIEVAEDCPVTRAEVPPLKAGKKTKAGLEYELIARSPYRYTGEEVAFQAHAQHKGLPKDRWPDERARFLAQEQPCLRASALGKRYGWGVHSDARGRVALVAVDSAEYQRLARDPALQHTRAMRTKRA